MFELPKLDYQKTALAPIMSEQTLDLHHGKHHQTYITNLNNLIKGKDLEKMTLEEIIKKTSKDKSQAAIFNNASQHWNHILFWKCMKPNGGGKLPPKLDGLIKNKFGNVEKFRQEFINAGITQFGSGWCWLSINNGELEISKTPNAESPVMNNIKPMLGCDVWEHSYYLDYKNKRPEYLEKFFDKLINWEFVESNI